MLCNSHPEDQMTRGSTFAVEMTRLVPMAESVFPNFIIATIAASVGNSASSDFVCNLDKTIEMQDNLRPLIKGLCMGKGINNQPYTVQRYNDLPASDEAARYALPRITSSCTSIGFLEARIVVTREEARIPVEVELLNIPPSKTGVFATSRSNH